MEKNIHKIFIESRSNVEVNGVTDIGAYNDEEIELDTVDGLMIISGSDLNITKLDVETGICKLSGRIDSIYYTDKNENNNRSLFKRIFKWRTCT